MDPEVGRHVRACPRHTEARDEVNEPPGPRDRLRQPRVRGGRCDQADQRQRARRHRFLDRRVAPSRKVGEQQAGRAGGMGVGQEASDAVSEHGIQVRHDHDRDAELRLAYQLQDARHGDPLRQRGLGGALDGRPVGERVAEGHSDFHEIGSGGLREAQGGDAGRRCGIARGEVRDQRGAAPLPAPPFGADRAPPPRDRVLRQSSR